MVMEFLVLIAILVGPFLGIWAQSKLENRRQSKQRKLDIFKTLMATRGTPLSPEHVGALNRIDMEFHGRKEKMVRNAWNTLLNHFGEFPKPPSLPAAQATQAEHEKYEQEKQSYDFASAQWAERAVGLRISLLREMGNLLEYDFDEVHIKKAAYNPKLHEELEITQRSFLEAANEVFTGKRWLPMFIVNWPEQQGGGDD